MSTTILSFQNRVVIETLHNEGCSLRYIANYLGLANCRMRLASHWQNKKRHCDVSCIILSDQTEMRRYVQ